MSIEAEIVVTIVEVSVDDDYRIDLHTPEGPRTPLDWSQAEQLANELLEAVESAKRMMADDFPRIHPAGISHGFDVTTPDFSVRQYAQCETGGNSPSGYPDEGSAELSSKLAVLCRDCREGHCGACIGRALVEDGGVLVEVACDCDHGQVAA